MLKSNINEIKQSVKSSKMHFYYSMNRSWAFHMYVLLYKNTCHYTCRGYELKIKLKRPINLSMSSMVAIGDQDLYNRWNYRKMVKFMKKLSNFEILHFWPKNKMIKVGDEISFLSLISWLWVFLSSIRSFEVIPTRYEVIPAKIALFNTEFENSHKK